jgi:uncharacterized protein YbbC (DUF1343 family)
MKCNITIVPVKNYKHDSRYILPINPSPNLNTQQSIDLYPSICLFEGTYINLGRGTQMPFTILGSPALKGKYTFSYTPTSIPGMSETPLFMNQICYGINLNNINTDSLRKSKQINIDWMIELYKAHPEKEKFFDRTLSKEMGNIDYLAGVAEFKEQIKKGISSKQIRKTWEPGLKKYKAVRKKYLLYN